MNKEKKIDVSNKEPTTMREIRLKRKNIKGIKFMSYLLYSYMNNLYIPTIFLFYSHMNTSILICIIVTPQNRNGGNVMGWMT